MYVKDDYIVYVYVPTMYIYATQNGVLDLDRVHTKLCLHLFNPQTAVSDSNPGVYQQFIRLLQQHCHHDWRPEQVITTNILHFSHCHISMWTMTSHNGFLLYLAALQGGVTAV